MGGKSETRRTVKTPVGVSSRGMGFREGGNKRELSEDWYQQLPGLEKKELGMDIENVFKDLLSAAEGDVKPPADLPEQALQELSLQDLEAPRSEEVKQGQEQQELPQNESGEPEIAAPPVEQPPATPVETPLQPSETPTPSPNEEIVPPEQALPEQPEVSEENEPITAAQESQEQPQEAQPQAEQTEQPGVKIEFVTKGDLEKDFKSDILDDKIKLTGKSNNPLLQKIFDSGEMSIKRAERALKRILVGTPREDKDSRNEIKDVLKKLNLETLFLEKFKDQVAKAVGNDPKAQRSLAKRYLAARAKAKTAKSVFGEMERDGIKQLYHDEIIDDTDLLGIGHPLLEGKAVHTPDEVAMLAQTFHDSQHEIGRVLVVKGGKVHSVQAFSLGMNSLVDFNMLDKASKKKFREEMQKIEEKTKIPDNATPRETLSLKNERLFLMNDLMEKARNNAIDAFIDGNVFGRMAKREGAEGLEGFNFDNGVDGVYFIHNHPGGNVDEVATSADTGAIAMVADHVAPSLMKKYGLPPEAFRGGLVVDHNKYMPLIVQYTKTGRVTRHKDKTPKFGKVPNKLVNIDQQELDQMFEEQFGKDVDGSGGKKKQYDARLLDAKRRVARGEASAVALFQREEGTPNLGAPTSESMVNQLANVASQLRHKKDTVYAYYCDVNGRILGLEEISPKAMKDTEKFRRGMQDRKKLYGAERIITFNNGASVPTGIEATIEKLHASGDIFDHVCCDLPENASPTNIPKTRKYAGLTYQQQKVLDQAAQSSLDRYLDAFEKLTPAQQRPILLEFDKRMAEIATEAHRISRG